MPPRRPPRRWPPNDKGLCPQRPAAYPQDIFGKDERVKRCLPNGPLWEIFIRGQHGLNHRHVGSLHAPDAEMAMRHARDVYTRRNEGVSIWVVPSSAITASSPSQKGPMFEPSQDKVYRHPSFFDIPDEIGHM